MTHDTLPANTTDLYQALAAELRAVALRPWEQVEHLLQERLTDSELRRMLLTARMIPTASRADAHLVDIGGTPLWLPIYRMLGYAHVSIVGRGGGPFKEYFKSGEHWRPTLSRLDADAELDPYPLTDGSAACVVAFELLEHFAGDPMHFVAEANRILSATGCLCLTTPNVLYYNNIAKILIGEHPSTWSVYTNSYADRHNREYTPFEVKRLLECGGFSIQRLTTYMLIHQRGKRRVLGQMAALLSAAFRRVPLELRQEKIFVLASKSGQVVERFPIWLYTLYGRTGVTVSPRSTLLSSPDA